MGELELYSSDGEETDIVANLSAGYDVLYDQLVEEVGSEEELKAELCRIVEATVFQEIQAQSQDTEIHDAMAELIFNLQDTEEVDVDALVQNAVHRLVQSLEEGSD